MTRKAIWKPEFSIGIGAIDRQHQQIFERLLAVENSVEKKDPWHVMKYLVRELPDYMRFHFAVEEALLEIVGYPELKDHGHRHGQLLKEVAELEAKIQKLGATGDLLAFFEDWFIRHVLSEDMAYAAFARERLPKRTDAPGA